MLPLRWGGCSGSWESTRLRPIRRRSRAASSAAGPKPKARIKPTDVGEFRQLFACLRECDRRWPGERFWHSPQGRGVSGNELTPYSALARYLNEIRLFPREVYGCKAKRQSPAGIDWITFPARVGSYSEDTMLQPLSPAHRSGSSANFRNRSPPSLSDSFRART